MKKLLLFFVCCFTCPFLFAQFTLRLIVDSVATRKPDDIYVAGNFNNWTPGDTHYKMKPFGGIRRVFVFKDVPAGKFEFKFTRGGWDKVETTAKGEDVANHEVNVGADTSLTFSIAGWHDDYPDKPKPNTATAQVQVLDTAFAIPQLNRTRRIWIYLPKSYNFLKGKSYPVLYMQDGQNLFNEQTAAFHTEWGIDECLDTLAPQLHKEFIVIGIDNDSTKRLNEYNPYDNDKYGKGEGKQYLDFVANTLKPFVDKNYRTLKDAKHTFIGGSSMGGLISMYALVQYSNVFGGAAVFSPSFWIAPEIYTDVTNAKWQKTFQIYFYAGEKESDRMVIDMQRMFNIFKQKNCCRVEKVIFPLGQHNEKYWRDEFDDFYRWLTP